VADGKNEATGRPTVLKKHSIKGVPGTVANYAGGIFRVRNGVEAKTMEKNPGAKSGGKKIFPRKSMSFSTSGPLFRLDHKH